MRPSVSLVVIAKNEINNIDRWYNSVSGLFDEYIFCDTGSTDGTIERAKELGLTVVHFEWIDDFAAARNAAFSHATSDYVFWVDLDDSISDKEAFLKWRDNAMKLSDYWLAPYHYAIDHNGKPICSFVRERCWKRSLGLMWRYFIHEGVTPIDRNGQMVKIDYVKTWTVNHHRTLEDLAKDKGRNLRIFKKHLEKDQKLDPRMHYYYGKELFEAGEVPEAAVELAKASANGQLELHDRILCLQYTVSAFSRCGQFDKALMFARLGIELSPNRAEFWVMAGDCYVGMQKFQDAIPYYSAARKCQNENQSHTGFVGLIFTMADAYGSYPTNMMAKALCHLGNFDEAEEELELAMKKWNHPETKAILDDVKKVKTNMLSFKGAEPCDDIVFTCPGGLYEWDSDIALTRGIGGSEQACVHMARELKKLSGKRVIVFNQRGVSKTCHDGVEYLTLNELAGYFAKCRPQFHVAWRHNFKMTDAKTYVWSHDLFTPGGENAANYVRYMCLSEFHKNYVSSLHGVADDKILVTKNGIVSDKFSKPAVKNPLKIVFPSSPDRGLEKVIKILDYVREVFPVELFVFYGFDNMRKMGLNPQADAFETMIKERAWIHSLGNQTHDKLLEHYEDAALWVYPTDFLETSCITAMECVSKGIYPIVRSWGALPFTLKEVAEQGMCKIIDSECRTETQHKMWADEVISAIKEKAWEKVSVEPKMYDWNLIAQTWLEVLPKLEA